MDGNLDVVISSPLIHEVERILLQLGSAESDVEDFIALLLMKAKYVLIKHQIMGCRDKKDDPFLETVLVGNANWIITKDKHLLQDLPQYVRQYFARRHVRTILPHKYRHDFKCL